LSGGPAARRRAGAGRRDEGWRTGSLAGEIVAAVTEAAFFDLDAPPVRVCSREVPVPYAKHLEDAVVPRSEQIVAAVHGLFGPNGVPR
jgi:pyruvate dehydrogenase E1 component beta subunit